jgi:hypothetical protein
VLCVRRIDLALTNGLRPGVIEFATGSFVVTGVDCDIVRDSILTLADLGDDDNDVGDDGDAFVTVRDRVYWGWREGVRTGVREGVMLAGRGEARDSARSTTTMLTKKN